MSPGDPLLGLDSSLLLSLAITLIALDAALILGALVPQRVRQAEASYRLLPVLLSPAEARLAASLTARLPPGYHLLAKPRLADLLTPQAAPGSRSWWRAFNRISAKHLDFVLCDAAYRPALALELDDRSHQRPDRRRRDRLVEQALARAGLPLLRLRPARSWPELPQLLHEALARSPLVEAACPPDSRPAKAPRPDGVPA